MSYFVTFVGGPKNLTQQLISNTAPTSDTIRVIVSESSGINDPSLQHRDYTGRIVYTTHSYFANYKLMKLPYIENMGEPEQQFVAVFVGYDK